MVMSSKPDETDSDHVSIEHISPHPSPGASQVFFQKEITTQEIPDLHSEPKSHNPYDNIENVLSTSSSPPYARPNKPLFSTSRDTSESTNVSSQNGTLYKGFFNLFLTTYINKKLSSID